MRPVKILKAAIVGGWILSGLLWAASSSFSQPAEPVETEPIPAPRQQAKAEDYVGSETCKDCHAGQFNSYFKTAHARLEQVAKWPADKKGCEACHGPGRAHVEAGGDKSLIKTFEGLSTKTVSETCLSCHAGKEEHNNYRRGEHWRNDVGCTDCHAPHSTDVSPLKMLAKNQPDLCIKCHNETKAQFSQPFHHKVLEGAIRCSDCHNPHGGFEKKQARLASGTDAACVKCHADKQGPFVFEHAPLKIEGCTICHTPHGATNPKLLKRNDVRQLCLECHSDIGTSIGAPGTPSFHNQAPGSRFRDCTTCHVKIHGSQTHPHFFR